MLLNKNLIVLLSGFFLVMVGFGITLPVLPFYIQTLSVAEGISTEKLWIQVGLITGSYPLMQFLFSPFIGSWSDKVGRRPPILIGLIGYSIATFLFSISTNLIMLYVFRLLAGLFSAAFLTASVAYITDKTTEDTRARGMSLLVSATALGTVAGPLLGNLFSTVNISFGPFLLDRFSFPFAISSVLVLLVVCFLFFTLMESHKNKTRLHKETTEAKKETLIAFLKSVPQPVILLLFFSFISQLALAMFEGTFALHSKQLFAFGPRQMNLVFIICGLIMGTLSLGPIAWLIKKTGETALLPYGFSILGLGMSLLMISQKMEFILIFVSLISAGMAILTPALASLITKKSDNNHGITLGLYNSAITLGQLSGVLMGSIMLIWFQHLPYLLVSFILLIVAYLSRPHKGQLQAEHLIPQVKLQEPNLRPDQRKLKDF